jgi:hypothetical protein
MVTPKKDDILPDVSNRRVFVRLPSNFPVEYTIVRLQGDLPGITWQQGHTCNVSKGGLCLETGFLDESVWRFINRQHIYLEVKIHVPFVTAPVKAVAEVQWFRKIQEGDLTSYLVGLKFRSIIASELNQILRQAKGVNWVIAAVVAVATILFFILIIARCYALDQQLASLKL